MASRSLQDLTLQCQLKAEEFVHSCEKAGISILIYCTYRSKEEQDELYKFGRSLPGKKRTNARGGYSFHQHRVALDFVPIVNGKLAWDDAALYKRCGIIAENLGFEWAGRWSGDLRETAHIQYTQGKTIEQFIKESK